jgi:nucleotide-binding universal stress UspA family protein
VGGIRILVPIEPLDRDGRTVAEACLLAAPGGRVVVLAAIEVPLELPLDAPLPDDARRAHDALPRALAVALVYGVAVRTRLVRTRAAGEAVVDEAERTGASLIVVHMQRARRLDETAEFVLRHARCRVLVAAT